MDDFVKVLVQCLFLEQMTDNSALDWSVYTQYLDAGIAEIHINCPKGSTFSTWSHKSLVRQN